VELVVVVMVDEMLHLQLQELMELQILEEVVVGSSSGISGNGGKGVVILSMPLAKFSNTTTGSPTESDDGTTKVLIFNGSGSYTT
jgi:hypothetical protein